MESSCVWLEPSGESAFAACALCSSGHVPLTQIASDENSIWGWSKSDTFRYGGWVHVAGVRGGCAHVAGAVLTYLRVV